jgi:predicted transcriptional regulator
MTKPRQLDSRTRDRMARILAALVEKPKTSAELMAQLFISKSSMVRCLRRLQDDPRQVRVADYLHTGSKWSYIYALGAEPDAPMPKQQTRRERWLKELAQLKADPELRDRYLSRHRAHYRARAAARTPHGWASALLGSAKQGRGHADA